MDSLPNEIFARILLMLHRYSITALILTCKVILNKSNDDELLDCINILIDNKTPKSKLLILYDYSLVSPQYYIPVYFEDSQFPVLLSNYLEDNIAQFTGRNRFRVTVEISTLGISEFFTVIVIRNYEIGEWCLYSPDHEGLEYIDVYVGIRRYEIDPFSTINTIIETVYHKTPYHVVNIIVKEY